MSTSIIEQAIVTESRQQFAFRQLEGLFPVATWFMTGLTQLIIYIDAKDTAAQAAGAQLDEDVSINSR
ncbi:hypothetical protein OC834_006699 [Tilletia horrida]|nr:hypothetical protein OC834_006699 [Tilletia horrida]